MYNNPLFKHVQKKIVLPYLPIAVIFRVKNEGPNTLSYEIIILTSLNRHVQYGVWGIIID